MLRQEAMIETVCELCRRDERVVAAFLGGSFAAGEGDEFGDLDLVLFFADESLPGLDRQAWTAQIAPLDLFFPDEWGHFTAIFADLVRCELHFEPASTMGQVEGWAGMVTVLSPGSCILVDKTGELAQHVGPLLAAPGDRGAGGRAASLLQNLANMVLYGGNVLARGEAARALEVLNVAHRSLMWLARLAEGQTYHWVSPTRWLEKDLSPASYARYVGCCAGLDVADLWKAYRATWQWGRELAAALAGRYDMGVPETLKEKIAERLGL